MTGGGGGGAGGAQIMMDPYGNPYPIDIPKWTGGPWGDTSVNQSGPGIYL